MPFIWLSIKISRLMQATSYQRSFTVTTLCKHVFKKTTFYGKQQRGQNANVSTHVYSNGGQSSTGLSRIDIRAIERHMRSLK